ncbi:MAG: glucoamylase family protein [Thermoanaerobacteraceae bacterium]
MNNNPLLKFINKFNKKNILDLESEKCFRFFWEQVNLDENSSGFGLIRDRFPQEPSIASIASVGFGLSAIAIGVNNHWISYNEGFNRVSKTLDTLINNVENINGFYYHFIDINTGKRIRKSEVSIIDTAILINGAIFAGEFFGGIIKIKAEEIYKRTNWVWYLNPETNLFYMGYTPERGFFGSWDWYAEQFMVYFLAVASPTFPVNKNVFYDFKRIWGSYGFYPPIIHTWTGSIFTYQYSFAWFDLRNKIDKYEVNWWFNSIIASKSNRQFCIDNKNNFKTFDENSWGLTACDGPEGYKGSYGAAPSDYDNNQNFTDGTVPPAGAAGSIVFTPKDSVNALNNFYNKYKDLWGEYGFKDAYNLDVYPEWYAKDVIGIDKGITLLMIENYKSGLVWKYFMKNKYVQGGMKRVGIIELGEKIVDDFDGNTLTLGWKTKTNINFNLKITNDNANTGLYSLRVDYKNAKIDDSYFYAHIEEIDLEYMDIFGFYLYGKTQIKISFIDKNYKMIAERVFKNDKTDIWKNFEWDLSDKKDVLSNLYEIRVYVQNSKIDIYETLYIDNLEFKTKKPIAHSVFIEGKPIIGSILDGNYIYHNLKDYKEYESSYRWLISDYEDRDFLPIPNAVSLTYKIKADDIGKYIKFEITPRCLDVNGNVISGKSICSIPIGEICEGELAYA